MTPKGDSAMKLSGLSTPALVLDAGRFRANAEAMNTLLKGSTLKLRPHYKSHKCAAIARWQIEHGAIGMTCSKLSEAEDLCDAGIEDILLANQVVDPAKIRRLADLAANCRLTVCVDTAENIRALSAAAKFCGSTIHCLVEYETGMQRCGVGTEEEFLALAKEIVAADNLEFDGIQAYVGHVSHMEDEALRRKLVAENDRRLNSLISRLQENGIKVRTVSGGSTGTAAIKAEGGPYTELQAGSYLFLDGAYRALSLPFENALFVLTTVVSRHDNLTVLDAGVKTCGTDQGMPTLVEGTVDEIISSEEHFQLHGCTAAVKPGDKMMLIPGHCCSTVNLHDKIYLFEGDTVVGRIPVTARGIGR